MLDVNLLIWIISTLRVYAGRCRTANTLLRAPVDIFTYYAIRFQQDLRLLQALASNYYILLAALGGLAVT